MLFLLIWLAIGGLIIGGLARLALPGPDPMSIWQTMAVGIAGSLIAGIIGRLLFGGQGGGLTLGFICSFLIVYAIRRHRGGTLTRPAPGAGPRTRRW